MGSIVRSTGYKVLHRPVELARLIGRERGKLYYWQMGLRAHLNGRGIGATAAGVGWEEASRDLDVVRAYT
jgi:hypothetical protein